MKKLTTLFIVLVSFCFSSAVSAESVGRFVDPCVGKICVNAGVLFMGTPMSLNFCCNLNGYTVSCGFERMIEPGGTGSGRVFIENWVQLVNSERSKRNESARSGWKIEVVEDVNVASFERDDYYLVLLSGTYLVEEGGAVVCDFRKVLKQ